MWKEVMVVSWPPCWVAVLAKTLPTLPTRAPFIQWPPVWSKKFFICAAMLPKRVGVPKMTASYSESSSTVAIGAFWSSLHVGALGDVLGHQLGHPLDRHLDAVDLLDTLGHGIGHGLDMAVGAVIEHENLRHPCFPPLHGTCRRW